MSFHFGRGSAGTRGVSLSGRNTGGSPLGFVRNTVMGVDGSGLSVYFN